MKKITNILSLLLMVVVSAAFVACGDDVEYTPGEQLSNAQVYFSSNNASSITISKSANSFEVPIMRINTDEAITVPVTATGGEGIYTIPSSISFAQGESSAVLAITYDPETLEYDVFTSITLRIGDESITTPYGMSEYSFTVGAPAPWTSLGECTFVDDFITALYGVSNEPYAVEIQENDLQPGYFRLVNPFGAAYPYNEEGDWDSSQDWFLEIHAENPEAVYITVQETGMDWGYGMIYIGSMAGYYIAQGATVEEMQAQGFTGTYKDGIISFPVNTLLAGEENYNNGALYPANANGAFKVAMPGVVLADYSLGVAYTGKYTNAKGEDAGVIAQLTEVGEDIDAIRLAVVEGTDVNYAVECIRNGSIDYVEVSPATEQAMLPFAAVPVEGQYTIVAVGYNQQVAEAVASATFKYTAPSAPETWTAINVGDYTYTLFFGTEEEPAVDSGLTLFRSNENPNRYKIEHWGYDVDFIFTYNAETSEVVVEEQETGYTHPSYGMVMISDLVPYTGGQEYGYSYYENGVFHFAVVYFVSEGEFALGEETFAITGEAGTNSAATRSMSMPSGKANKKVNVAAPKFSSKHIKSVKNMIPWSK